MKNISLSHDLSKPIVEPIRKLNSQEAMRPGDASLLKNAIVSTLPGEVACWETWRAEIAKWPLILDERQNEFVNDVGDSCHLVERELSLSAVTKVKIETTMGAAMSELFPTRELVLGNLYAEKFSSGPDFCSAGEKLQRPDRLDETRGHSIFAKGVVTSKALAYPIFDPNEFFLSLSQRPRDRRVTHEITGQSLQRGADHEPTRNKDVACCIPANLQSGQDRISGAIIEKLSR